MSEMSVFLSPFTSERVFALPEAITLMMATMSDMSTLSLSQLPVNMASDGCKFPQKRSFFCSDTRKDTVRKAYIFPKTSETDENSA